MNSQAPAGIVSAGKAPPASAMAWRLAQLLKGARSNLIYVAASDRRAEATALALQSLAPHLEVLHFPAWDCLPYDRAAPSREAMGCRIAVLQRLLEPSKAKRVLITSPDAVIQRVPPAQSIAEQVIELSPGQPLKRESLETFAERTGYVVDERVDEPGEIALLGNVVDIFPADGHSPVRITDEDGIIQSITSFDPGTQRSSVELSGLVLRPASELIMAPEQRRRGMEHHLAAHCGPLQTLFDYLPKAKLLLDPEVPERITVLDEQIADAYATAQSLGEDIQPTSPSQLYLDGDEWAGAIAAHKPFKLDRTGLEPLPDFSTERNPSRATAAFAAKQLGAGHHVVLCGTPEEQRRLRTILQRNTLTAAEPDGTLLDLPKEPGLWFANLDIDRSFADSQSGLTIIAAADVFGASTGTNVNSTALLPTLDLRVGDVVVHEDHGVAVLDDLTSIETEGVEQDIIRLRYHGDAALMVPVQDFGKLWRYGAEADAVKLDRLNTDAWAKKRAQVSAEIEHAAQALAQLAAERLTAKADIIEPPRAAFQRLAARFPYPETPDQAAAITAVLNDLASGRPMNRLVCGDVGFGKTEIALRAAAAVALSGKQVAIVAPTTVLARQHLQSFERRFAGTDIAIGHLSRLNTPAEAKAVKAGLRDGSIRIVVATHAIAADDVEVPKLGLVVIDEEQRFGAKLKQQLEDMAKGVHLLSMSATPIPRTLQSAMVGLQDLSVIATPPARRRPIRTFLSPYDPASARTALMREQRRGGQSFFVVPRIEDIDTVAAELKRIVPELSIAIAHGDLPPKQIDTALVDFANGTGDVLLATNIVESGLDVPRANTMLIWRADRFGLSQLHQLRGRVGRGRAQGIAYLFTDPEEEIAEATRIRLSTLEAFDRLGAGFEIAARDLELRGAGDLLGEDQAGHVHLIGAGLYQQLLERALAAAKGGPLAARQPAQLNLGVSGMIPADYVPEAVVRINLHARLQRFTKPEEIDDFADELEDRFGARPCELEALLATAKLALLAADLGIQRIDAGPKAIAITPGKSADLKAIIKRSGDCLQPHNDRLTAERDGSDDVLAEIASLLASP